MRYQTRHRNKLAGFTIIEIVVAMLITGIVLGLGYSGFLLVQRSYQNNQKEQQVTNDIARLKGMLDESFYRSEKVEWNAQLHQLSFDKKADITFEDSLILVNYRLIDTLWITHDEVKVKEVLNIKGEMQVERLEFDLTGMNVPMVFGKSYNEYAVKGLSWN